MRAVLERTAIDVDHVNHLGWTALLECVILGDGTTRYQEIARILVAHGADVSIADARRVARRSTHARTRGYREIADDSRGRGPRQGEAAPRAEPGARGSERSYPRRTCVNLPD